MWNEGHAHVQWCGAGVVFLAHVHLYDRPIPFHPVVHYGTTHAVEYDCANDHGGIDDGVELSTGAQIGAGCPWVGPLCVSAAPVARAVARTLVALFESVKYQSARELDTTRCVSEHHVLVPCSLVVVECSVHWVCRLLWMALQFNMIVVAVLIALYLWRLSELLVSALVDVPKRERHDSHLA